MNAVALASPAEIPDWKHCAPYFLAAIALHLLALAWPRTTVGGQPELPPASQIKVHLVDQVAVSPAVQSPPSPPAKPAPSQRERPQKTPRTILAMPAKNTLETAAFTVSPIPAALPTSAATVAETSGPVASAAYTPARFNATYLHNPPPAFPPLSRRLGEEGKVLLRVKVSAAGQPVAVDLEKGSNFERLDDAARQAVARWRFVPAKRGDEAVEGTVIVPIVFRLDD
jgi:periplasmic protein TonB